jgi:hypothetical protein
MQATGRSHFVKPVYAVATPQLNCRFGAPLSATNGPRAPPWSSHVRLEGAAFARQFWRAR